MALRDAVKAGKKDIGAVGGVFIGASAINDIANGESALKVFLKTLKDVALWTVSWRLSLLGAFGAINGGIKSAIASTGALEAGLRRMGDAAQKAKDELDAAQESLKARAGESWAASEVDRMKDLKAAVEAITPAVSEASKEWDVLGNGMSEFSSKAVRAGAESGVLGGAIGFVSKALSALLPVVAVVSGLKLAGWFSGLAASMTRLTGRSSCVSTTIGLSPQPPACR